jgi:hypothetical protein
MRNLSIVGAVLAVLGLVIVFNGCDYTKDRTLLKVGSFEANIAQKQTVPPWLGGVALVAGIVLIVVGQRQR